MITNKVIYPSIYLSRPSRYRCDALATWNYEAIHVGSWSVASGFHLPVQELNGLMNVYVVKHDDLYIKLRR